MGDLQATVEFLVELYKFYNVDLFIRGYYQLRFTFKPPKCSYAVQAEVCDYQDNRGAFTLFPAFITDDGQTAVSRTFNIYYKDEEVLLKDVFLFRVHLLIDSTKAADCIEKTALEMNVDVHFTDQTVREANYKTLPLVTSRTLKLHLSCFDGLHHQVPLLFDYYYFSVVDLIIHASVTSLSLPNWSVLKPVKTGWFSKSTPRSSSPLFFGTLFGNRQHLGSQFYSDVAIKYAVTTSSISREHFEKASAIHRNLCAILAMAHSQLLDYFEKMMQYLDEKQRIKLAEKLDPADLVEGLCKKLETLQSCEEVFDEMCSDLSVLNNELALLWSQFQESFALCDKIRPILREQHHRERMRLFSEAFFIHELPWKSLSNVSDSSAQKHTAMGQCVKSSRYISLIPPVTVECAEVDGDSTTTPIFFEDRYVSARESSTDDVTLHIPRSVCIFEDEVLEHKPLSLGILNEAFHDGSSSKAESGCSAEDEQGDDAREVWVDVGVEKADTRREGTTKERSGDQEEGGIIERAGSCSVDCSTLANVSNAELGPCSGNNCETTNTGQDNFGDSSDKDSSGCLQDDLKKQPQDQGRTVRTDEEAENSLGDTTCDEGRKTSDSSQEKSTEDDLGDREAKVRNTCKEDKFTNEIRESDIRNISSKDREAVIMDTMNSDGENRTADNHNDCIVVLNEDKSTGDNETVDDMTRGLGTGGKVNQIEDSGVPKCSVSTTDSPSLSSAGCSHAKPLDNKVDDSCERSSKDNVLTACRIPEEDSGEKDRRIDKTAPRNNIEIISEHNSDTDVQSKAGGQETSSHSDRNFDDSVETPCNRDSPNSVQQGNNLSITTQSTYSQVRYIPRSHTDGGPKSNNPKKNCNSVFYDETFKMESETNSETIEKTDISIEQFSDTSIIPRNGKTALKLSSNSSSDMVTCFCGGNLGKTSSPYRPSSEIEKTNVKLEKAKQEVKSRLNYCGVLYSDLDVEYVVRPYFMDSKPDLSMAPVHFVICVHGLEGNSGDLRLLRCFLEMTLPSTKFEFLMSEINQDNTFLPFDELTEKLISEIIHHIEAYRITPSRISFIGHSLGNIIIRSALTHPLMEPYVGLFHTFLSLSGPHLGMIYHTSSLVSTGLWLMQKWKKSASLLQLSLNDSSELRQTFLYKLSKKKGLEYFTNVLLVSSVQDHYVPFHSSRIELPKTLLRNNSPECSVYREMMENILTPLLSKPNRTLVRYSVYHCLPSSTNSFIGRAAHIAMLDSELFIEKLICRSAAKYFQ